MDEEEVKFNSENEVEDRCEITGKIGKGSFKWKKANSKWKRKMIVRKRLRLQEIYEPRDVILISDDDSKGIAEKVSLGSKANFFFLPDYELENLNSRSLAKSISKEMMTNKWWFNLEKSYCTSQLNLKKRMVSKHLAKEKEPERRRWKLPRVLASKGLSRRRKSATFRETARKKSKKNLKRKLSIVTINNWNNSYGPERLNEQRDYDNDFTELEALALFQRSSPKKSKN